MRKFSRKPSLNQRSKVTAASTALDKYWAVYDNMNWDDAAAWDDLVNKQYPGFADRDMTEEIAQWALDHLDSIVDDDQSTEIDESDIVQEVMDTLAKDGYRVESYESAGVLTNNDGFVIKGSGGKSFYFSLLGSYRD